MQKLAAELFGTFFLVLAIGLTGNAMAIGLLIASLVFISGHLSGAQFNPAISIAFWSTGKLTFSEFIAYSSVHIIGSVLGALAIFTLSGAPMQVEPASHAGPAQYAFIEMAFTSVLALLYLTMFLSPRFRDNQIFGFAIGLAYAALITVGEPISGAVMNPAVAIGISIVELLGTGDSWRYLPVYILAPVLGAFAGAILYRYFDQYSLPDE